MAAMAPPGSSLDDDSEPTAIGVELLPSDVAEGVVVEKTRDEDVPDETSDVAGGV